MKTPQAAYLEKLYADFAKQDWNAVLAALPDTMTFQIAGKSPLAGKYTKATFAAKLDTVPAGQASLEVHDILTSDRHATVLGTWKVSRGGKTAELRTVHVWRMEGGKPVAWYEYERDLYQFDAIWS